MTTRHNACVVVAILLAVSTAQADTIYVDVNCPGPGNGSEAEPYCSIQTAIDNAVDTDEIVVAPGTYFETINFLGKAITLRSSDGPEVTIIDGQQMGTVVTCNSGEGPETVVEGLTITHGSAPDGAGMLIAGSSPIVKNCLFIDNAVDSLGSGGAISIVGMAAAPAVTGCAFTGNHALVGGGVTIDFMSYAVVTGCLFEQNTADIGGGGMFVSSGASATIHRCTFFGNDAVAGGAITHGNAVSTISDSLFAGNTASELGGGIAHSAQTGILHLVNCTIAFNTAGLSGGGILDFMESTMTVDNCIVWGNTDAGGMGGSAQIDGLIGVTVSFSDVQNGWTGAGAGNIDAEPAFLDGEKGDYRLSAGSPCIDAGDNDAVLEDITIDLDGNPRFLEIPETPDTGNGTLPIVDMGAYESLGGGCLAVTSQEVVCHADGTTFTVNIEGLNACTGGTTQVTFTASGGAVGEELCFTALVNDGGFCCSTEICVTIPDCTPAPKPSDLDGDGIVDIVDFLALLAAWGSCSDCGTCPADFDGDCSVGILDLLILLGNWG